MKCVSFHHQSLGLKLRVNCVHEQRVPAENIYLPRGDQSRQTQTKLWMFFCSDKSVI